MTNHALDVLEFERVLERVALRASSDVGRTRIRSLRPVHDAEGVARELARVATVMRFLGERASWSPGPIPEIRSELSQLTVEGAVLEPVGLYRVGVLLTTSREVRDELMGSTAGYPEIAAVTSRLIDLRELEKAIHRCVDEEGHVLSTASAELKRLRDRLRGAHARIVRKLETYLGTLAERFVVPDGSITIREGRYVIPVRREGKKDVGGIVHDESQTGATLYIEPPIAVEAMNQLRELERDEAREVRRVLGDMTARLAPEQADIAGALEALADFDSLYGRARAALRWGGTAPDIVPEGERRLDLKDARHPLLIEADEGAVVPFDLSLEGDEFCLVVSGPNTGGKSVFLKATGLIAALTQSGVIAPVGPGTSLPVFTSFFADIGDEQSIARNLSTFSAHLANLSDLVSKADARSLVLIDEMGTGTDPAEGAALSRAVIEELVARGATTIVSSHLGELKQLDSVGSGIVNASLQFDSERMQPTYRLIKGRPGRSYGLAIARRLGFPANVLDRADAYRSEGAARMDDVLENLERQEQVVEERSHQLDMAKARTERLKSDIESREQTLKQAERTADVRAREDARRLLLDARTEVESAIQELRAAAEAGASFDEAAKDARRRVESAAANFQSEAGGRRRSGGDVEVREGDRVRIAASGARGNVVELRTDRAMVEVGAMRLEVAVSELERLDAPEDPARRQTGGWTGPPKGEVRLEVDLRGLRVDEVGLEVERALDEAILEDLSELRIIHGKGTGALRSRVAEVLADDPRVREYRMGGPTEGGAGVTVASFGVAR
ncbi:MAG: endonuclease MutS2 [Gemmatimonadetes bacterium]|nr:endonuclease MutS2 [Gemmatimonadota bacterium]